MISKQIFETPQMEIISMDVNDVIATSGYGVDLTGIDHKDFGYAE